MSISSGSKITTGGLIYSYDMNNPKSWKGKPVINIARTSGFLDDYTVGSLNLSVSTSNPNGRLRITSTSGTGQNFRFYFDHTQLTDAEPYTLSFKYTIISSTDVSPLFRTNDWCDQSISRSATDLGAGVVYEVGTGTRSTYNSTYRFMDMYMTDNTVVEIWNVQLEKGSFATPFTEYQRSTTDSVVDLTGSKTTTVTDLEYNADGTFEFDGVDDRILINDFSYPATWDDPFSIEAMVTIPTGADWQDTTASGNSGTNIVGRGSYAGSIGLARYDPAQMRFILRTDAGTYTSAMSSLSNDTWYHLVGVWDPIESKIYLYVNGVAQTGVTVTQTGIPDVGSWKIGGDVAFGGNVGKYGEGTIPLVRIYDKTLSATDVSRNFSAIRGRYGI